MKTRPTVGCLTRSQEEERAVQLRQWPDRGRWEPVFMLGLNYLISKRHQCCGVTWECMWRCLGSGNEQNQTPRALGPRGSHPLLLQPLYEPLRTQTFKGRPFAISSGGSRRQTQVQTSTPPQALPGDHGWAPCFSLCLLIYKMGARGFQVSNAVSWRP